MWAYAPNLYEAIEALLRQGGRGVMKDGIDRVPHLSAAIAHGWKGIQRGLPQSYVDLELAAPGTGLILWLGYQLRAVLEPLFIRARPLPNSTRAIIWVALAGLAVLGTWGLQRK